MIYNNCGAQKTGPTKIPNQHLWRESWSVWGYVGVESAESSFPSNGCPYVQSSN